LQLDHSMGADQGALPSPPSNGRHALRRIACEAKLHVLSVLTRRKL